MEELEEINEPIGKFILDNSEGAMTPNGAFYHYTDVCRLLKLYHKTEIQKLIDGGFLPKSYKI